MAEVLTITTTFASLCIIIYILVLMTRFVKAHERIASALERPEGTLKRNET